jgi:hypothetical protein
VRTANLSSHITSRAVLFLALTPALSFSQRTQPENDNWQKMKDCAVQAEKVGPGEADVNKGSYSNHYSPKYNRCYLRISWLIKQGDEVSGQGLRLVDAFEHNTIALYQISVGPSESKPVCFVDVGQVDCSAAKDFISEHMRN